MSSAATSYQLFATCPPGLEDVLGEELKAQLPLHRLRALRGGVELRVSREELWSLALRSRIADTLRVRIGRFKATQFRGFVDRLKRLPWAAYLSDAEPVRVEVTSKKSALIHSGALAQRVYAVLGRPIAEERDVSTTVWVRVFRDQVTVSVDVGAGRLHRRGWRQVSGAAPLRETFAASLVHLARAAEAAVVWDPFCGSGTLLVEACLAAQQRAPRTYDEMAFSRWPSHDADAFNAWSMSCVNRGTTIGEYIGSEVDAEVIAAATSNVERAGVAGLVTVRHEDMANGFNHISEGAVIVSNTPYGKRLRGGRALRQLFERFGEGLVSRPDLKQVTLLVGYHGFEDATRLAWRQVASFSNQGLPVRVLQLAS